MNDLSTWNYQESVEKMRVLVPRWKNVTTEMLDELFRARLALSKHGPRGQFVSNGTNTWTTYLDEVGLARQTVHRWLAQYDPQTKTIRELSPPGNPIPELIEEPEEEPEPKPGEWFEEEPEEPEIEEEPEDYEPEADEWESDTDIAADEIIGYMDIVLGNLDSDQARHTVVNALIKELKKRSIEYNQKAAETVF